MLSSLMSVGVLSVNCSLPGSSVSKPSCEKVKFVVDPAKPCSGLNSNTFMVGFMYCFFINE